jgi:riboflavin synthase
MFTGIVTDIGTIERTGQLDHGKRFIVRTRWDLSDLAIGASVAHAGVCLTVVEKGDCWFATEAWEEALRLTTLGDARAGTRINLERSLRIGDELGGHMVSGHVDGKARILERRGEGGAVRFILQAPEPLARFIAPKGSVALDGTSLTVNAVDGARFDVLLIAHTLDVTTWGERQAGDDVNLEIDQMARYAARLAQYAGKD